MNRSNLGLWRGLFVERQELGLVVSALAVFRQPLLLMDLERQEIVFANAAFLELTAFSFDEVVRHKPTDLLDNLPVDGLRSDMSLHLGVHRRKRSSVRLACETYTLDLKGQWLLVTFHSLSMLAQAAFEERIEALIGLQRLHEAKNLDEFMTLALNCVQRLCDVEIACLYFPVDDLPVLRKGNEVGAGLFPDELSSADWMRLSGTILWTPGRRVMNELHRAGRVAELEYVASKLLGDLPDSLGLLVVGGMGRSNSTWLTGMLEVCGLAILGELRMRRKRLAFQEQQEAERLKRRLDEQVLESMSDGVVMVSPELRVLALNPAAEWLLGYASEEVYQQRVENILIGPDRILNALEMACHGLPTHNLGDESLHRRNGLAFPARVEVVPVMDGGELLAILIFISDQSEQEQNRQRSQQLEHRAVLGEFTAVFAHEVRNPINNISTGLQLLASRLPSGDSNMNVIQRMMGDCLRLSHLMESVLSFSRSIQPAIDALDLQAFLQRVVDRWRPAMMRNNVEVVFQADEDLVAVAGDMRLLEQVFTNLIGNAIDAMKVTAGGTLGIHLQMKRVLGQRSQVKITISDTGPGIPAEILPRLFEPFVTTKPQGTGLGLAICKRIITAHEGVIGTETFPGGTIFSVYLPVYQEVA